MFVAPRLLVARGEACSSWVGRQVCDNRRPERDDAHVLETAAAPRGSTATTPNRRPGLGDGDRARPRREIPPVGFRADRRRESPLGHAPAWRARARTHNLPAATEERLEAFADLAATAIANVQGARGAARGSRTSRPRSGVWRRSSRSRRRRPEVFAAVTDEVGTAGSGRCRRAWPASSPDGTLIYVASWGRAVDFIPVGSRWTAGREEASARLVFETGRPARVDSQAGADRLARRSRP